jgi:tape measure domain-containing protein
MATEVEKLIVRLEVSQNRFEKQMAAAARAADKSSSRIEQRFARMNKGVSSQFALLGRSLGAAFAGALTIKGAASFIDSSIRITNALKGAGLEGEALTKVYDDLFAAAQRNSAPFESLVKLYGRVALNMKELNTNSSELVGFTNTVAMALRAGGTSATEASGALMQLSQSLGGGTVRAEEFNSILEGAPVIAQAAAAGIREAGGSVAKLRELMLDGKVSSEGFFRGIQAGAPLIAERLEGAQRTISDSFTNLYNSLTDAAKEFNDSSQAANTFGTAIDNLAKFIDSVSFDSLISQVQGYIDKITGAIGATNDFMASLGRATGLDKIGEFLVVTAGGENLGFQAPNVIRDRMAGTANATDPALDAYIKNRYPNAGKSSRVAPTKPAFNPISLDDYKPTGDGKGSKTAKAAKERADEYEREVKQIQERTAAITAETAAQATVNPLIDDYGYAVNFASVKQDLLNAAQEAGVKITPEVTANIQKLAEGYAAASMASDKLRESQDQARQSAQDVADLGRDALSGFVDDMRNGVSATEALGNALDKIADKLIDGAFDMLFDTTGKSGGGFLAGIGKLFGFAKGGIAANGKPLPTFAGGGVSKSASIFGEAGPEAAVPLPDGRRIPVDLKMPAKGSAKSGGIHIGTIDARGAQQGVGEEIRRALTDFERQYDRALPGKIAKGRQMNRGRF